MKRKHILGLVCLLLAGGLAYWLLTPPAAEALPKTRSSTPKVSEEAKMPTPTVAAPSRAPQVAAPVAQPVRVAVSPPATNPIPVDPHTDLSTAIPDFVRMVESGDYVGVLENYFQLPPNVTAEQFLAQLQRDPGFPQLVQRVLGAVRATQTLTPTLNDSGDVATYKLDAPVDEVGTVRWKKVNGNWYMDGLNP